MEIITLLAHPSERCLSRISQPAKWKTAAELLLGSEALGSKHLQSHRRPSQVSVAWLVMAHQERVFQERREKFLVAGTEALMERR